VDKSVSPETIRWFLDGSQFFSINSTRVDATTWANATNHPYFILFDLAIGGGFPAAFGGGPTAATVSGGEMIVDYVAVYTRPGGGTEHGNADTDAEVHADSNTHGTERWRERDVHDPGREFSQQERAAADGGNNRRGRRAQRGLDRQWRLAAVQQRQLWL